MAFDANVLTEINRIKAGLEVDSPSFLYDQRDRLTLLAILQMAIGGGGGGGGGSTTLTVPAAAIEAGIVSANDVSNAITVTPSTRLLTTNASGATSGGSKTIAAGAIGYQIAPLLGSFTLGSDAPIYEADGLLRSVDRPMRQGIKWAAITINPNPNSIILVEEFR